MPYVFVDMLHGQVRSSSHFESSMAFLLFMEMGDPGSGNIMCFEKACWTKLRRKARQDLYRACVHPIFEDHIDRTRWACSDSHRQAAKLTGQV